VDRTAVGVLDAAGDPVGERGDRVPPRRLAAAEAGQVDGPSLEPAGEQVRQVRPVLRGAAEPVHVQGWFGGASTGGGVPEMGPDTIDKHRSTGPRLRQCTGRDTEHVVEGQSRAFHPITLPRVTRL
jgi:hypothetical protein